MSARCTHHARFLVGLLALVCLLAVGGGAHALELAGDAVQGNLMIGTTAPEAEVRIDGHRVRVSPEGAFLIALDRDAPRLVRLEVHLPGHAEAEVREITVQPRTWNVQRIDGIEQRKVTPAPEDIARITADSTAIREARKRDTPGAAFLAGFAWPVAGRLSGVFGSQRILNGEPRQPHRGIDIAAPQGTPIHAMAAGHVSLAAPDMFFTGKTLILDHGHGLSSVYAHLHTVAVQVGDAVQKGEVIGTVGSTGRATGPHLHWGISVFDAFLDPETVVPR